MEARFHWECIRRLMGLRVKTTREEESVSGRPIWRGPTLALPLLVLFVLGPWLTAQSIAGPRPTGLTPDAGQIVPLIAGSPAMMGEPDFMKRKRLENLNKMRQKSLVQDTEKLLRLARQLSAELAADSGGMSPEVRLRQAAEIEKLARDVKEKMSYGVNEEPSISPPFINSWP